MKIVVRTYNEASVTVVAYDVDSKQISVPGGPRQQVQALAFMALDIAKLLPATADLLPIDLSATKAGKKGSIPLSISITDRRGHEIFAVEPAFSTDCETPAQRDRIIAALAMTIGAMTPVMSRT